MRKVLNFVKGKRDEKKDTSLSLNVANISVEITDPAGVTTPSDDYDFVGTTQQCTDYEVDLSGKDKSITKLHKASWVGNLEKVKSHLKKIDVNIVDNSNRTPLHLAAAQGHTHVVWFLLSNKAQMDIIDVGGKTSLLKAVEGGYKEIVSNMLEKGADLNLKDADENTALHIATKLGYYDIATVLLKNGANFESANKKGEYALHIATTAEHMDLVELLLRYGAAVNVTDLDARTPLMLAARCGNAPLVELFLEYGAKRDMVDNSSFTAQDYAINKGYSDLAALLVTATMERIEEEDKLEDTETDSSPQHMDKQKSVSSGSLVPATGSNVDVSDELVDVDSWNDSQSESNNKETKIPHSKLKKFLSPSSDDEISNEQSPAKEEKNVHDSPNSCVIPPPLKPPRSWDLIQAGMIDDNTGSEVKRCSLTALGTLRSRRESFNDSVKSDLESPMSLKDSADTKDMDKGEVVTSKTNSSSKVADTTVLKRDKSDLSAVESDWDSDESLPLDKSATAGSAEKMQLSPKLTHKISVDIHHELPDDDDLPAPPSPSQLEVPEDSGFLQVANQSAPGSGAVSPEPVSEKRARMLLMQNQQSVELTLTDDRTEDKSDHSEGSPSALPKDGESENNDHPGSPSVAGTLGRDGTMLGYDEMWESNAAFAPSSPTSLTQEAALPTSHSLPRIDEKVETSEGEQSPSSQIIIDLNVPKITEISSSIDILTSPVLKSISSIPPPVPLAVVGKSEEVEDLTKKVQDSKFSAKRHVRNKSIFQLPLQSEPTQPPEPSIPQLQLPSAQALHDQIINRQLECYDIAIRDLAASSPSKRESPITDNLNPITIQALKSTQTVHSESFVDKGHRIMPDLLAGSKVAALAAAFGGESNQSKKASEQPIVGEAVPAAVLEEGVEEEEEIESDEAYTSQIQGGPEKPLRKKRKSLLAMQKLEPTSSQGSRGSQSNEKVDEGVSSSDSDDEPAYWGSAGMSKVLRQSTVIKKGDVDPQNALSHESFSLEDIEHTSTSGSSNEDVTAPVEDVAGSGKTAGSVKTGGDDTKLSVVDSDAESCASQTDETLSHSYAKNHESLLKHHLQVVTEERGRLAETTVELGEKTERLMYELADAREAARARDEVISMLQTQLQHLEESHIKGLEEVQTHRFHLDSRDQELRHLEEVCLKAQEEATHLKEIIRLKDKEIANLTQMRASRDEEAQMQSMARNKDKDMTINELRIHLKYVEQERDRLKETLVAMEHQQASLQARTEALVEDNARTSAQLSNDLRNAQEETNKWRNLYESCLLKLEAMDSTQVKVLLDAKSSKKEAAYQKEILSAVERLEKEKDADRKIWQAKIKDEVASAVHLLKSEYEKVEETLRKHNATLEAMVEKLQINHDIAIKRQESLENQLRSAQNELQQNKREISEVSQLQLEFSRMKHQAATDQNKLKTLESELDSKEQSLIDLRKTLEIVRQEKKELSSLLSSMYQKKDSVEDTTDISQAFVATNEETGKCQDLGTYPIDDYPKLLNDLLKENGDLKHKIDQLNSQIRHLHIEHTATLEQLNLEKAKNSAVKFVDNQGAAVIKVTQELENSFRQEKEELLKQITDLRMKLQKRDSSPSSANLCNASAMTDQVRWNQSGLMGVVQKQKEEIENLKSECTKLRSSSKSPSPSPSNIPPEIKPRPGKPSPKSPRTTPDTIDLLKSTKKEEELSNVQSKEFLQPYVCKRCNSSFSPNKHFTGVNQKLSSAETQTIEGCESPAHTSKCSSPRHSWNQKTGSNIEQELQAQAEKCLKHQQMIAGLKSELQLLRGGSGDCDYQYNLQKQVSDLQQKIKDEMALRSSLELQMNKMKYEVQEKGQVEKELQKLKGRLEKDFVSRRELDHFKMQARSDETSELTTKLAQVNKLLLQQAHDRSSGKAKESVEAQIHKEYEETQQYLSSELAKVQASLQAKESEERELKLKCEKLSRECDKKNEQRRKMLIEKSYNLGQQFTKEKFSSATEQKPNSSVPPESSLSNKHPVKEPIVPKENPYSQLLRKEVKKNAEKYKVSEPISDISSGVKAEEHMVYLKKKYCLP
ncbi:ankyrin repeat domain-containing protein 26-like [Thrips palmi]|uniref:Ankyrin repeat domain-containing protein 26-like n=1 Tax=Thrips palmi TaxID=161013 RepID=A0A6P9A473_THRPL|nr:ankyrin repeat domain-containing protein 26-like [Thrips palmi]XP_034252679.1 ankyrin repeat domain-containing protein 26-like [Thrips palmi]